MVSINDRLKESWNDANSTASRAWSSLQHFPNSARECVDDQPVAMTFAAFGIGVGVGVALGLIFHEWSEASTARSNSFANQAYDVMSHALPAAVARQFHV